ncbi:extracellular solute-binding protein [Alsobacter sp. SYSU M60028]|uniref:Extracellular solute-binding protein n=1 Tax=Alsobacter ponti TaxID=2962936 RepID=A0ABT1LCY2_9HYPH|nr:extracellular solute-binding protein [Alsobacter ponti]MCP8938753.1 extracellular solute-binding protein [Alsobacter ponti]
MRFKALMACLGAVASAFAAGQATGQTLSQADEAKLYEAARKEGQIVWYEAAPIEPMQELVNRFSKKYPGIEVQLLRITGPQQYQRFMQETEAGQHIADLLLLSDQPLTRDLAERGHLAKWRVPTHDRVPEPFRIGEFAYAPYTTDIAIVYNTNKVSEEEAKILASSWKGVLDPRFKGRFAIVKRKCGSCYAPIHMFLDEKFKAEYGEPFLRAVAAQKPLIYSDNPIALDRIVAGERDFVFWLWEAIAVTKWQQGAPIRWVRPTPTPEWGNSWQAVSAHAPHPNAARLMQNWLMSEEGAIALQAAYGSSTVLTGVQDSRPVTKEPWHKPIAQRYDMDWDRWEKNYESDMTLWQKIQDTSR